jgi:hypothetical protein
MESPLRDLKLAPAKSLDEALDTVLNDLQSNARIAPSELLETDIGAAHQAGRGTDQGLLPGAGQTMPTPPNSLELGPLAKGPPAALLTGTSSSKTPSEPRTDSPAVGKTSREAQPQPVAVAPAGEPEAAKVVPETNGEQIDTDGLSRDVESELNTTTADEQRIQTKFKRTNPLNDSTSAGGALKNPFR